MVIFDLICSQGHQFEGWFENLQDLEIQVEQRLIACPVCEDIDINRLPSTFGVVKKHVLPEKSQAKTSPAPLKQGANLTQDEAIKILNNWRKLSETVEKEFDDVGAKFSEEALKIHYGSTKKRNIRGQSTDEQEKILRDEGVTFFKLPMLTRKNSTKN